PTFGQPTPKRSPALTTTRNLPKRIFVDGRKTTTCLFPMTGKMKRLSAARSISQFKNANSLSAGLDETFLEPLAAALAEKKITTGLIIGKTNFQEREENINKFQNGALDILLCNIQSAGMGLNLSRAETIIFADRSYSPADNEQAEARFLPTTNSEPGRVRLVIDLICQGTIDEKILQLLKRKEDIIKVLNSNPGYFFS
ncbi:33465_t:CDS:2, partial [Racocetra persica]